MAAKAPAPKGKGLNGKIGGVPVKIVIAAIAGIAVLWYLNRRNSNQAVNSAGTNATPTPATDTAAQTADSTGGVSNSDLLSALQSIDADLLLLAAAPKYVYTSGVQKSSSGGGNTSTPASASSPTTPTTSHPTGVGAIAAGTGGVGTGTIADITGIHQGPGGTVKTPTQTPDPPNVHRPGAFL
jgi:hypothetical protein